MADNKIEILTSNAKQVINDYVLGTDTDFQKVENAIQELAENDISTLNWNSLENYPDRSHDYQFSYNNSDGTINIWDTESESYLSPSEFLLSEHSDRQMACDQYAQHRLQFLENTPEALRDCVSNIFQTLKDVLKGSLQEKVEEDGKITYKAVEAKMITSENDEETVADEATPVTGQTTFVPEAANGTVDVIFTFDGTELEDVEHTYVAFEDLYYQKGDDEIIVREHKDINDAEQTVYVPHIQTEVQDTESKSHNALADEKVTLEDTVSYEGLIPGKEYTMTGTLMDKETGKALLVNDKEVTAETKFVPEKADGTVVVTFTFDATGLEGKTLVAFETCTYEGKNVAVHADINDEKQTIYVPELHTTATDKADGDKQLTSKGTLTVVDKIAYKNLIPGQKYTVTGVLMDKATKSALVIGGKEVTATKTFVPNKADGTVEIEFTFKGDGLESKTLVAFETISTNDSPVGEHKDINDTDQTVTLTPPPIPAVQTGDTNTMPILAVVTAVLVVLGAGLFIATRKKKNKK